MNDSNWEYGIAHVTRLYPTRHEAIGAAARLAQKSEHGPLDWTKSVEAFNPKYD